MHEFIFVREEHICKRGAWAELLVMRFQWSSSRRLSLLSVLVFAKARPFVEASRVRHHCIITDTIVLLSVPPCVDERGHPYYPWVSNVDINWVCAKQIGIKHVSYDVRWRADRRRGPAVYLAFIFRRQLLRSCCRRLNIVAKGTVSKTQRATSTQRCETISVPQDNPLDTRYIILYYYRHHCTRS